MSDLTTRKRISNSLDKELYKKLKKLSKETSVPMSKLLDKGIELVLETYRKS